MADLLKLAENLERQVEALNVQEVAKKLPKVTLRSLSKKVQKAKQSLQKSDKLQSKKEMMGQLISVLLISLGTLIVNSKKLRKRIREKEDKGQDATAERKQLKAVMNKRKQKEEKLEKLRASKKKLLEA